MRFELQKKKNNQKNVIYVKILDDNGKHIGNIVIRCFWYTNKQSLKKKLKNEASCTRIACMEAVKHIGNPGVVTYVENIELDYRERGNRYGPQVLQFIPQICAQFKLPYPKVLCAYISPNNYKLDLQSCQTISMTHHEHRAMRKTMHKTFRRAGYKRTNIFRPHIVVKRLVNR